jgi:hypothetical protein
VPGKKRIMRRRNPAKLESAVQLKQRPLICLKTRRTDQAAVSHKGYHSLIEKGIQVGGKQEAIEIHSASFHHWRRQPRVWHGWPVKSPVV